MLLSNAQLQFPSVAYLLTKKERRNCSPCFTDTPASCANNSESRWQSTMSVTYVKAGIIILQPAGSI